MFAFRLPALRAIQLALAFTHSVQAEVRKYADIYARQKLTEFITSLSQESKHYKSNLEVEKAPEVLHFILTEISSKSLVEAPEDYLGSEQAKQQSQSYKTLRSKLLLCLFEAYPISKGTEDKGITIALLLTPLFQLAEEESKKKCRETISVSSSSEQTHQTIPYIFEIDSDQEQATLTSPRITYNKLLADLLVIDASSSTCADKSEAVMPGSSNTAGSGVPGANSLSNMAAVAAMAAASGGTGSGATGVGGPGNSGGGKLDNALPELVRECGYQFTVSVDACRNNLRNWIGGSGEIHAATVARIIGVMVRTHTGLDDSASLQNLNATGTSLWEKDKDPASPKTWNLEVFIQVVHDLPTGSTLHWKEIIYELDHPGFLVKDRQGLIILIKALKLGFQIQGFQLPFPVDMFYRQSKNSDGQVTPFQQILRNLDIFNFADHHHHPVAVEVLKGIMLETFLLI